MQLRALRLLRLLPQCVPVNGVRVRTGDPARRRDRETGALQETTRLVPYIAEEVKQTFALGRRWPG